VAGIAGGVGPVAAAVSTAMALGGGEYDLVVSAGIAGGFPGRARIGELVVADSVRWADLGAATEEGFLDLAGLGLAGGEVLTATARDWAAAALPDARLGQILTLATMTGTDRRGTELAAAHPEALAEAMEGYGVAWAAKAAGVPWVEIRAISNLIGRRDRSTWNIPAAFATLRAAFAALVASPH
jgi:futalosine hydrolase